MIAAIGIAASLVAGSVTGAAHADTTKGVSQATNNKFTFDGKPWRCFDGTGALGQRWRCSNVSVVGGVMNLRIPPDSAAGVHLMSPSIHQGTWKVTFRIDAGQGSRYAILVMPDNSQRPEVDFAEGDDKYATRQTTSGTYHPKPGCQSCIHLKVNGNFTAWHTAGLTWNSSGFTWTMDGKAWGHVNANPGGTFHLNIQTARVAPGALSTLQISSVSVTG